MFKATRSGLGERPAFGSTVAVDGDVSVMGAGGIDSRAAAR